MSQSFETRDRFETEEMPVLIEARTYSGSGFGVNEDGDGVFFSKRMMEAMDLWSGPRFWHTASRTMPTSGTTSLGGV